MQPIVSPWIFYVMNVLNNLNHVTHFLMFFLAIVLGISAFVLFVSAVDEDAKTVWKKIYPYIKICFIAFIASGFLSIFIPSKETMLQMLVASYVTPDNIQVVQENTVQFVQEISQAIVDAVNK